MPAEELMRTLLGILCIGLGVSIWLSRRLAVETQIGRGRLWAYRQLLGKTDS